jgi:hypothetical protein
MVKGDPSNMTVALSYCDGSEPWETLARAYESGVDQQWLRPLFRSPRAPMPGTEDQGRGREGAVMIKPPTHGGNTLIVCWIADRGE